MESDRVGEQQDEQRRVEVRGQDEEEVRVLCRLLPHHARHTLPLLRLRPHGHQVRHQQDDNPLTEIPNPLNKFENTQPKVENPRKQV